MWNNKVVALIVVLLCFWTLSEAASFIDTKKQADDGAGRVERG
jgi:hypothetical protein